MNNETLRGDTATPKAEPMRVEPPKNRDDLERSLREIARIELRTMRPTLVKETLAVVAEVIRSPRFLQMVLNLYPQEGEEK